MLRIQIRLVLQLITLIRNERQDPSLFIASRDSVSLHGGGEVRRCYVGCCALVTAVGTRDGERHDDFDCAGGGIGVVVVVVVAAAAQLGGERVA